MASPRTPPELIPDAVTEVLLRVPPDDPAGLVRAAAVCRLWRRILAGPAFCDRYRELHGARRHVLGFLHNPAAADQRTWYALDWRHGRALIYDCGSPGSEYVVWDPVTGRQQRTPDDVPDVYMHFAVVCADTGGCDHTACSGAPFLLVCVGLDSSFPRAHACFFSSETGEQSVQIDIDYNGGSLQDRPAALLGDSLYFVGKSGILLWYRYDPLLRLGHKNIYKAGNVFVMTAEDGGLGLASLHLHKLSLWARETGQMEVLDGCSAGPSISKLCCRLAIPRGGHV